MKFDYLSQDLHIGDVRAENDWDFLSNHFISLGVAQRVSANGPAIVIGRKGSGKTALRLHFHKGEAKTGRSICIAPTDKDLEAVFEYATTVRSSPLAVEFIANLWEAAALMALHANLRNQSGGTGDALSSDSTLERISQKIGLGQQISMSNILEMAKDGGKKLEDFAAGRSEVIRSIEKALSRNGDFYYLLIDSVDDAIHRTIDSTKRSDLFSTFFEGLLSFFRSFTDKEKNPLAGRVILKLFIPQDVYNWASNRHADHLSQYKCYINWNAKQLDRFMRERLVHNLDKAQKRVIDEMDGTDDSKSQAIWNAFFPETIPYSNRNSRYSKRELEINTRWFLAGLTLRRPRDYQLIVDKIAYHTKVDECRFPTKSTVLKALCDYSSELKFNVVKEYESVLSCVPQILTRLAGNSPAIDLTVLEQIIGCEVGHNERDIVRALNILYEACIIGTIAPQPNGGNIDDKTRWMFYYDFENFDTVRSRKQFIVHEAFWHSLQMSTEEFRQPNWQA